MQRSKEGIALLITVLFVIVITVAIGFGLKQVNRASESLKSEKFLYQSSIIVEDVLNILKNSPDVARSGDENASDELFTLLSQASFIPFEMQEMQLVIKLSSARAKFNPAALDANSTLALREYMNRKMVNSQYVDILLDSMSGIKADNSYNSAIFDTNPYLFRDYIASQKHLDMLNEYYKSEYNDNALQKVALDELFYFGTDANTTIDLNYATSEVWQLLIGAEQERGEFLAENAGDYSDISSLELNDDEEERLQRFKFSFFEPILLVEVEIVEDKHEAYIRFEYDIKKKVGSNFVYEI